MPEKRDTIPVSLDEQKERQDRESLEIIAQIRTERDVLETSIKKLAGLSNELRSLNRTDMTETGRGHRVFADTHLRLAGLVSQGVKRTASADRFLDRSKALDEENKRQEEEDKARADRRAAQKRLAALTKPSDTAFEELYGEIA